MGRAAKGRTIEDYNAYQDPETGHVEYALPGSEAESYLLELGWDLTDGEGGASVNVSEAAAKLAEAEGIDLSEVTGTGKGGNITKGDVEKAIAEAEESDEDDEAGDDDE